MSKCTIVKIIKDSLGVNSTKKNFAIFNKSSTIPEVLVKNVFYIHKGNRYRIFKVSRYHIGFKFGEFILTKKSHIFKKKQKKNRR
jgi:ribosomal protein S19